MKFSEIIIIQAKEIGIMWAAGMTIGLLWDLLSLCRRRHGHRHEHDHERKSPALLTFFQDILFWVLAALLASHFLYYCSFGQISFHSIAALAIGCAMWRNCFVIKKSQPSDSFCDIMDNKTVFGQKGLRERRHGEKKKKPRFQGKSTGN